MAGDRSVQFDLFSGVSEVSAQVASPPMMTAQGWRMPESQAFVAALRRSALVEALGILNRLKVDSALRVLLETGFTVGSSTSRATLMAPVQRDIIEAAQRGLSGYELRTLREEAIVLKTVAGRQTAVIGDNGESDATLERSRSRNELRFAQPYVAANGVQLVGYVWPNKKEEFVDVRGEDRVRVVSDWEKAVENLATGRQIVHQFAIKLKDGSEQEVSAESAAALLDVSESTVRGNAKKMLERAIRNERTLAIAKREAERIDAIDALNAQTTPAGAIETGAMTYSANAPMVQRMIEKGQHWASIKNPIERSSAGLEKYQFLVRDGRYIWSPEIVSEGDELHSRGWRNVEITAARIWGALTKDEVHASNLASRAAELAGQVQEESGEIDFEPAEILSAMRNWAAEGGFAEAEYGNALVLAIENRPAFQRKDVILSALQKSLVAGVAAGQKNGKTDDAGAELTYNRRNRVKTGIKWGDISGKDAALRVKETTKGNVYPKPDYAALIAAGMQPVHAHVVKQIYDAISPKPDARAPTDEQLQTYIAGVNRVMEATIDWANSPKGAALWDGMRRSSTGLVTALYPDGWKSSELSIIGGTKLYSALQPGSDVKRRAAKAVAIGWPEPQEAWQKQGFSIRYAEKVDTAVFVGERRDKSTFVAVSFVANGARIITEYVEGASSEFDAAVQEALATKVAELEGKYLLINKRGNLVSAYVDGEAAKEAARAAVRRGTDAGINDAGIKVENARRVGVERRESGVNITTDQLIETFGFKGVNFGTWMKGNGNDAERQLHVNHIYDAFLDLAELLNVPAKAMSLNGMLGIAVGAQGGGSFAAHFVPGVNEINLTRTSGAGSLAHEFGHALDHYFARMAGLEREELPFLTEHASRAVEKMASELRPEVFSGFKKIVETMLRRPINETEMKERHAAAVAKAEKGVESWLTSIRRDFALYGKETFVQVAGKNAQTIDVFDALAERVRSLDIGEGYVSVSRHRAIFPVVADIRELYKKATGRLYPLDNAQSLHWYVDSLKHARDRGVALAAGEHQPQMVRTSFKNEASKLDEGKQKPYWATTVEMFARSFDAYVSDRLEDRAAMNSYLSHAGRHDETTPQGDERTDISAAFDGLIANVQWAETEKGIAMFSFAGERASTANSMALGTARSRLDAGEDAEAVRRATGWFKGVDAKWRFEISDADASLAQGLSHKGHAVGPMASKLIVQLNRPLRLSDVLTHPALFAAYPALADFGVTFAPESRVGARALIQGRQILVREDMSGIEVLSALLHETQHGIQRIEGFATGGDVSNFKDKSLTEMAVGPITARINELIDGNAEFGRLYREKNREFMRLEDKYGRGDQGSRRELNWDHVSTAERDAYFSLLDRLEQYPENHECILLAIDRSHILEAKPTLTAEEQYWRLAGEVEARNVQARQLMTDQARQDISPDETTDVRLEDVVVMFNGREMKDAPRPQNLGRGTFGFDCVPDDPHSVASLTDAIDKAFVGTKGVSRLLAATGRFEIIESKDIPPGMIEGAADARHSASGRVLAFVIDGKTRFVADNISQSENDVRGLLLHELGVHALRLGRNEADFQAILGNFEQMRVEGNPRVLAAFGRVPDTTSPAAVREEALGYFVEANPALTFAQRVTSWFKDQVCKLALAVPVIDRLSMLVWARSLNESDLIYMAGKATQGAVAVLSERSLPDGVAVVTKGVHIGRIAEVTNSHVIQDVGLGRLVAHDRATICGNLEAGMMVKVGYAPGRVTTVEGRESGGMGR